jgi:peptidoglycan hydrolase CwlO-like protein
VQAERRFFRCAPSLAGSAAQLGSATQQKMMFSAAPTRIDLKHEDQKELPVQKQRRAKLLAQQLAAQAAAAAAAAAAQQQQQQQPQPSGGAAPPQLQPQQTPVAAAQAARDEAARARIGLVGGGRAV